MTYEYERYLATPDTAKDVLDYYGVAIVPNVLNTEECDAMNHGMWDTLEHLTQGWETPIHRDQPETWKHMKKLLPKHAMLLQHWSIGHAQYIWNVRQNPKVVEVFAKIWDCEPADLLVSFDGASYHLPPEVTKYGWYDDKKDWLHSDQSYLKEGFQCVQGWINGYDTNEGDATLTILESSHDYHADYQSRFQSKESNNWVLLRGEHLAFYEEEKACLRTHIKCPRGSLVLWDSRTIHCGTEAMRTRTTPNFRNVAYVCYEPRARCTASNLAKKRTVFENMRMTTHWPCKIKQFEKTPYNYGNPLPEVTPLPPPTLTELGRKLAGY